MHLLPRFSRLMAEALHCGGTPDGQALSLAETHERLKALADEERALPLPDGLPAEADTGSLSLPVSEASPDETARQWRLACDDARFAVYAWVDEQILQSSRLDAADWLGYSLQYHYFGTTAAGREFFARLTALLRDSLPPLDMMPPDGTELTDAAPQVLEAFVLHGGDEQVTATAEVYALCLLYGFRGMLHDAPETLARYRKAAHALLRRKDAPEAAPPREERHAAHLVATVLENAAYVLVPALVALLFGSLCAAQLADIPLPQF